MLSGKGKEGRNEWGEVRKVSTILATVFPENATSVPFCEMKPVLRVHYWVMEGTEEQ